MAGVVFAGLASNTSWAAGTVNSVSPNLVLNTAAKTLTFTTSDTLLPSPVPAPTVVLTRHGTSGASADTVSPSSVAAIPLGLGTTNMSATFDFSGVNPGAYDVEIKQSTTDDTCSGCLTVSGFTPVVTGASPARVGLGSGPGTHTFVIAGQNFAKGPYTQCVALPCAGPSVAILRHGAAAGTFDANATLTPTVTLNADGSTTNAPTAATPTAVTLRLLMTGTDQAGYDDDIVVTNTDGKTSATCASCLHVDPQPTVTSIVQPADAGAAEIGLNATHRTLVIAGTNLPDDSAVAITPPSGAVSAGAIHFTQTAPVVVGDHQEITLNDVDTTAASAVGAWNAVVSSPSLGNRSDAAPLAPTRLTVNAAPTATNLTYDDANSISSVGQGAQDRHISVSGANIVSGTVVDFAGLPVDVTPSSETADAVAQKVSVTLSATQSAATGSYAATLVNPDGGTSGACTVPAVNPPLGSPTPCPLVVAAGPAPSSISPNTVTGGYGGGVTITGTNLHTGASNVHVTVGPSAAPYFDGPATAVAGSGGTQTITIPAITVPALETARDTDVTVTNLDNGGTRTLTGVFHIANLSVTNVNPASGTNDAPATGITVSGTNFDANATVALQPPAVAASLPALPAIPGNVTANAPTSLTVDFDLTNAAPGVYQLVVTNPQGSTNPGSAGAAFTVLANAPTTSGVAPTPLGGGATDVAVAVTGTNFFPDSVVSFDNPAVTLVGAPVINAGRTLITQHVSIDPGVQSGTSGVTVTNTAGDASNAQSVTLDAAPTVVGVTPGNHAPGSFPVSVAGTGFASGATVSFSDPRVTGTVTTVAADGSTLTADLTVDPAIVPGDVPADVQVTVTNADFGQATSPADGDLIVDPSPRISQLTPTSLAAGSSTPLQVLGANFLSGATLATPVGSGLSLSSVQFVSSDELDAILTAAPDATQAARAITLDNQDGGVTSRDVSVFVAPGAPTALSVVPGDSSLDVSWSAPASDGGDAVSSYTVQVSPSAGGTPVSFTTPDGATTEQLVTGLTNGTSYDVSVVATNGAGDGPASAAAGTPRTVPAAPSLTVTPVDGALDLSWVAPADGGSPITGYTATVTPHAGGAPTSHPLSAGVTSDSFTGLTNGTAYDVELFASNVAGDGAHATDTATPRTVPAAPVLTVTPVGGELDLSWAAPADGGSPITGYTATLTPHAGGATTTHPLAAGATSDTFTGLTNGTAYDVSLVASNAAGASTAATATGTPLAVPTAPTALSVTPGNGTLSVSWGAPTDIGGSPVDTYTVTATPRGGGAPATFTTADASTTSHDVTGLTNGTLYDVAVTAHNAAGNGAPATTTQTPRTVPGAPTALSVVPGDGALTVSWSVPGTDGGSAVDHYTVTLTPHAGGAASTFTTPDGSTRSHAFTGLVDGTLYDVAVTAHNAAGDGAAVAGSGTPARAADAPSIRAIVPGDGSLTVSWSAPSGDGGAAVASYTVTATPHTGGTTTSFTTPDATTTTHAFGGLVNGTVYDVAVVADNSAGSSAPASGSATPRFVSTLTLGDTAKSVVYGTRITLSGVLSRSDGQPVAGGSVRLFRTLDGGSARVYRTLTTDVAGHWSTRFAPAANASYFASFVGDTAVSPATSGGARTTVAPRVTIRSPRNRSSSSAATALTIKGRVAPNKAHRAVVLYRVARHGKLVKLAATRLSSTSTYALTTHLKRGTWRLRVVIGRSAGNVSGRSATLIVKRT